MLYEKKRQRFMDLRDRLRRLASGFQLQLPDPLRLGPEHKGRVYQCADTSNSPDGTNNGVNDTVVVQIVSSRAAATLPQGQVGAPMPVANFQGVL